MTSLSKVPADTPKCVSPAVVFRTLTGACLYLSWVAPSISANRNLSLYNTEALAIRVAVDMCFYAHHIQLLLRSPRVPFSFREFSLLHSLPWNLDGIASHPPCNFTPFLGQELNQAWDSDTLWAIKEE